MIVFQTLDMSSILIILIYGFQPKLWFIGFFDELGNSGGYSRSEQDSVEILALVEGRSCRLRRPGSFWGQSPGFVRQTGPPLRGGKLGFLVRKPSSAPLMNPF